ncbi:hypothetical protein Tco_0866691 [Tanacetum coccineum]
MDVIDTFMCLIRNLAKKSVKDIINDEVKTQLHQILPKEVADFATHIIQSTITESLENVVLAKSSSQPQSTYEAATSLIEFELKKILLDKMQKSQSYQGAKEHKELFDGLLKSYKLDKDLFESYGKEYSLKRDRENKDKDEDPHARSNQHDWFKEPDKPPTPDSNWNVGKYVDFRPPQTWINKIAQLKKPSISLDELMSTPIDFSAYVMNHLKIDNLTKDHLVRPAFNLLKGTCKSHAKLEYNIEECRQVVPVDYFINNDLEYLKGGSSSRKYTTSTTKAKAANYLEKIDVRREDQQLYKFKKGDFLRLYLQDIKDRLLLLVKQKVSSLKKDAIFDMGVALRMFTRCIIILKRVKDLQLRVKSYQKKLNITKPETFRSDISNKVPYTTYNNPQGFIYVEKYKRIRLMRTDELYKFNNRTLTSVRTVLYDIASNLRMDYLLERRWSSLNRKRSRIMIKAIDKLLF